jgi:hypothetical protein
MELQMLFAQPIVWIVTLVATLAWTTEVNAQLAFIARHAIGRVEQMSQQQGNGGVAYDTAAVVVEVPAEKVYAVALRNLSAQPQLRITGQDQQTRVIQFTNSVQIAGLQVNPLSDKLSQILITSAHTGDQQNVSTLILERILTFCSEMKVKCSQAQN